MTKNRVQKLIAKWEEDNEYDSLDELSSTKEKSAVVDGVSIYAAESYGGMGKGDDYWLVLSVTENGEETFWKIPGWYASHHGGEYETENVFQVEPREKTITFWDTVKNKKNKIEK